MNRSREDQLAFSLLLIGVMTLVVPACRQAEQTPKSIKRMDPANTAALASRTDSIIKPELAPGLNLKVWGIDSLVVSPIAIDIDDLGKVYYVTTGRQKNSEFDIRGHKDWETESIKLQTVEDKRAFLHRTLSPENSAANTWLKDLNGDSSHDWRDMTVETEKVYRMQDLSGDGVADESEKVVDDFHDEVTDVAGGLLSDGNNLYVAVAPDLWKLTDKNGDGIADEKKSLSNGYGVHIGFGGHGMSGVEMGPDGRIYWQIGDIGFNGKGPEGQKWEYPNSGVIARSNPDGSDFEIFASGIRNTHEFAFDEYANLISEDNDGDHAGEKERLVYIVDGADIGWRSNWQYGKYIDPDNNKYKVWMNEKMHLPRFPGQAAYFTPCISNFVSGPAGLVYNPGTALGPEYKNSFFVAAFVGNPAGSGIYSFKLNQQGAGFSLGENKKVVGGLLTTGLDFGPDGALYLADWIEGWETKNYGRIWRLDVNNRDSSSIRGEVKALLAADFGSRNESDLGKLLLNPDMRVRLKAQFELVKRGEDGAKILETMLKQTANQLARVHSVWGLSQLARKEEKYAALLMPVLNDRDAEIRAQAAKWLGDMKYEKAGAALIPLLGDTNSRVRFFAAEALGRIKSEAAIGPIISLLEADNDQDAYIRHAGSLALARIGKPAPIIALASHPSRAVRIAAVVALRRMGDAGIAKFLEDKDEYIVTETARAINDDLSILPALPALGRLLNTTTFRNEALLRRVINANLRLGSPEAMNNLVAYAQRAEAPDSMRAEAIDAIGVWSKPSVLDRVDGRYRGEIHRDGSIIAGKAGEVLIKALAAKSIPVRHSAISAITRLNIQSAEPAIRTAYRTASEPELRIEALKALVALKSDHVPQAITAAIADKDKTVRVAGLDLLEKSNISTDLMIKLLTGVIAKQTAEEKQAAVLTLGRLPLAVSEPSLNQLLTTMGNGKLSPDLYMELGEAIDSSGSAALKSKYKSAIGKQSDSDLTASYAGSLKGGDSEKGKTIFFTNQTAQCIRCHSYNDQGGNVGPHLDSIGRTLTRPQLLEALISPSERLAPGFGMVTLELKNGQTLNAILENEDDTAVRVKTGADPIRSISKKEIVKRTNSPSAMPDMKLLLSKKEIRDLVSFLARSR